MNAVNNADWLRTHLLDLSNHNPSHINSVVTDTCSTMFSMWEQLESYDDFKHCLFIPCDSHGIQLLIKNILELPSFSSVMKQAQILVKAFRKAHLQYARLRENQLHFYGRHQSLILSVITRWGTQFRFSISKSTTCEITSITPQVAYCSRNTNPHHRVLPLINITMMIFSHLMMILIPRLL